MDESSASLFVKPQDRWDSPAAEGLRGEEQVIFRSRLVGSDPALTKEGGGNFSAKGVVEDHRGHLTEVLWMSAWGCDGAVTTRDDFPALRLADLRLLRDSGPLDEQQMIDHLLACGLRGEQRRPGIETLTHAFIPATHVDHCHPDAVIALTSIPDGRERAEKEFGEEAIWFDYRQFDVEVARELADRVAANPRCRFILLANHGLFTWADSSEQCYRNSLEAVARATEALRPALRRPADLGGPAVARHSAGAAAMVLATILPTMRGELSRGTNGVVLHVDRSDQAVTFASSVRGPRLSRTGPACPDHLVTVGYRPLVLAPIETPDDTATRTVIDGIESHRKWYNDYYEEHVTGAARLLGRRGDAPRVVVIPGIGVVTSGSDAAKARLCADHFAQTMTVIRAADAAGGYVSLNEAQGAADEYWPLMRLKPQLQTEDGRLAGRVALVAGTEDTDTVAVAQRLAGDGAHLVLVGTDHRRIAAAAEEIIHRHGERRAVAFAVPPDRAAESAERAALAFGGVDVVTDMTPSGAVAHALLPLLARQGRGGSVLLTGDRPADELRSHVTALRTAAAAHRVTVNAVSTADADAVAEAAVFFAGPTGGAWNGTTLAGTRDSTWEAG